MKPKFFFTAGVIGMLSGVASGVTDGSDVDYEREYSPYMTLRGGWLFGGDAKFDFTISDHPENNKSSKESTKSAWSGSGEFGVSCFDDRVFIGLELGYFTGKATFEWQDGADKIIFPAEFGNAFGACNVTLRHYFGERGFWYGGVGAGIARVSMTADFVSKPGAPNSTVMPFGTKAWSFLGQGFTGFGLCLNDHWQLTVGYRLRYLSGNATLRMGGGADTMSFKTKQDLSHAAEVGVVYRF